MFNLIQQSIVFSLLLYTSSLSAHVKGNDGAIQAPVEAMDGNSKAPVSDANFKAAQALVAKAVGADIIAEAKEMIQQASDKDAVTVMEEYITTELDKAKAAEKKANKALNLYISLSKGRKHTKADVERATEAANYAKDAEQAMTDALNAAKAAEAVMAEMAATAAKEAGSDNTKKAKAEKAKADADKIQAMGANVRAEVLRDAREKDGEKGKALKAAQEEAKSNTKQNTSTTTDNGAGSQPTNNTTAVSVTAMTSTIPTVLITSVVFLYLYNL